jgi:hypothetical protein
VRISADLRGASLKSHRGLTIDRYMNRAPESIDRNEKPAQSKLKQMKNKKRFHQLPLNLAARPTTPPAS